MPWDRSTGVDPKYRSREHVAYTKRLKAQLAAEGHLLCTAAECVMPTREITNPNGLQPDGLTAGHADNGVDYDGPQHRSCNLRDGAKRGRARQGRPRRALPRPFTSSRRWGETP